MRAAVVTPLRRDAVVPAAVWAMLALAATAAVVWVSFNMGPALAFVIAAAPALVVLQAFPCAVYGGVIAAVGATAALGRDFAYVNFPAPFLGSIFILDAALLAAIAVGAVAAGEAFKANRPRSFLILGLVVLSAAELLRRPLTFDALRDSVIGFYSLWALVGMAIVVLGRTRDLVRFVYAGGVVATAVFGVSVAAPDNPFSAAITPRLIPPAHGLYIAFAVLFVLLVPALVRGKRQRDFAYALVLVQGALIAASGSRSLWVALVIATAGTALLGGVVADVRKRLVGFALAFAMFAAVFAVTLPSVASRVAAQASTIVNYETPARAAIPAEAQIKAENAQWRLRNWENALETFREHPIAGVGFGVPVITDPAIQEAYRMAGVDIPRIDPHNSFIAFAARLGILGFGLLLLFELAVLRSAFRLLRRPRDEPERQLIAWLVACQLLTAGHSIFTVVLEGPYMGLFFWLFGGMVLAWDEIDRRPAKPVTEAAA